MKIYRSENRNVYLSLLNLSDDVELKELKANTTDAATEKHVPVVEIKGKEVLVKVGSVAHPMLEEHWITFIAIETNKGISLVNLKAGELPEAKFVLREDEKVKAVYEYCNLHGLWKVEL